MAVQNFPLENGMSETNQTRKAVKLEESDAYLTVGVSAINYQGKLANYRLKVGVTQRVDASVTAGFELDGSNDRAGIVRDLRAAADLFTALADELDY